MQKHAEFHFGPDNIVFFNCIPSIIPILFHMFDKKASVFMPYGFVGLYHIYERKKISFKTSRQSGMKNN